MQTPSMTRQEWLEKAAVALRGRFDALGYEVPAAIRISIGWPRGSHGRARAIGQCWATEASADKHNEIFISPELGNERSVKIIGVLAHELVHATVGVDAGHKRPFKQCAEKIGLCGKMTATEETPEFIAFAEDFIKANSDYPSGSLSNSSRKKQGTRMIKCSCPDCGYVARTTQKWIADAGAPICPADRSQMEIAS